MQENKQRSRIAKVFVRSPSKRLNGGGSGNGTDSQTSMLNHNNNNNTNGISSGSSEIVAASSNGKCVVGNKVTSKQSGSLPRKAWEQQSDDAGGPFLIEQVVRAANGYDSPQMATKQQHQNGSGSLGQSLHFNAMEAGHLVLNDDGGLVNVRLVADEQGRFGFNVKGGADLQLPVLVSRVAPNTPADLSTPRISEGDQVIMINGRDIGTLKHEQIVSLIRASREFRGGELVLTIKPQGKLYRY